MDSWRPRVPRLDLLDRAIAIITAALVPLTLVLVWSGVAGHALAPSLDLVLDTTAAFVTISAAGLLLVQYREGEEPVALFSASAFLLLAAGNVLAVLLALGAEGLSLVDAAVNGERQQYAFIASRALAAGTLVAGGVFALRSTPGRPAARLVIGLPLGALAALVSVVQVRLDILPSLLAFGPNGASAAEPDATMTALGVTLQLGAAALTVVAAFFSRRLWRTSHKVGHAYLAFALILASAAQLHAAVFPNIHPIQVSTADGLWLAFDLTILLGIEAESRFVLAAMRRTNGELARLRETELEHAAIEERNRLSRELHDGLAQALWFAKLKANRLASLAREPELAELTADITTGIETALNDARQAVMALRIGVDEEDSLATLLGRYVDDFADRFAIRAEFERDRDLPRFPPRVEAELLHVAQEALTNVVRHADATRVRVRLASSSGRLSMAIQDNGCGFEPEAVRETGYGLRGMRERAAMLDAELTIDSRPHDGTRVSIAVPVVRPVAAAAA
jgi:signal transduction histidine kinase